MTKEVKLSAVRTAEEMDYMQRKGEWKARKIYKEWQRKCMREFLGFRTLKEQKEDPIFGKYP